MMPPRDPALSDPSVGGWDGRYAAGRRWMRPPRTARSWSTCPAAAGLGTKLTVTINRDATLVPGTVVDTLTNPDLTASSEPKTYSFTHTGLHLDPNTKYWVAMQNNAFSSGSFLSTTSSTDEDEGGLDGWSIDNAAARVGMRWGRFSSASLQISISGSPVPTPFVSNLGQADGSAPALASDYAQAFTTGHNREGYRLTDVGVEFATVDSSFSSSSLTASIRAGSGGSPGGSLGTLTNPASFPASSGDQVLEFTSAGIDLEANTTYFLVIDISSSEAGSRMRATASDYEDVGRLSGWSIADGASTRPFGSTGAWTTDSSSLKISLRGASKPKVPDPVLVGNLGQQNGAIWGLDIDYAQRFTTGSSVDGYWLSGVDVAFERSAEDFSSKLAVTINEHSDEGPGAVVHTLTNPAFVSQDDGTLSFTHDGVLLKPDTHYWVVLDETGLRRSHTTIRFTGSTAEDADGADDWSIHDDIWVRRSGAGWIIESTDFALKIGIRGRAVGPTPGVDGTYPVPYDWVLKPAGLGPGDVFRLVFLTEDKRDATDTSIGVYDAFVRDAAAEGHEAIGRYADLFRVVGSTAAVDARDHTASAPGHADAEVWWLNGQRIARDNAGFWSSTWENWAMADRRDEDGERYPDNDWPWTGTQTDGTKHASDHLGNSHNAGRGRFSTGSGDTGPIDWNRAASTQDHAFYGISPLFRVEPTPVNAPPGEPAVMSNLGQADGAALNVTTASTVHDRAQSFTTGRNGGHYRLNSVDVEFAEIGDSDAARDLRVQIWAGSGGSPGSNAADVLADLARPSMPVGSSDQTFTFTYQGDDGSGLRLEPNTTYWVYVYDASVQPNSTYTLRATASNSERLQGLRLPEGWSIGDGHSSWSLYPNPAVSWSTHSESLKIGLNLGAADAFVQFRTCAGTVSGNSCDTGWVIANYTRHDPPPTITLTEGGPAVTYQWQAVDPHQRRHFYVASQVAEPLSHHGGYIGPGKPDRDRLMCHTGSRSPYNLGDPIVEGLGRDGIHFGYGSTAGPLLDRHDGCPFSSQPVYEGDANKWRPVSLAAGQDSDAFDHGTFLIHRPHA
ncbi:MAG: hypothetical protein OXL98_15000, partial [Acidimicrobiaceae bacterium]|nr:hypothetical protein [Acidimicrobiaceae bacterium]